MQFGRSEERRQAELDEAEREAYEQSPLGLAEAARARGDRLSQIQLDTSGGWRQAAPLSSPVCAPAQAPNLVIGLHAHGPDGQAQFAGET